MNWRTSVLAALLLLSTGAAHAAIVISGDPTQNMSCTGGTCGPTARDAVFNIVDLTNLLSSGNLTVTDKLKHMPGAKEIHVLVPLSWSSSTTLTFSARKIEIAAPILVAGQGGLAITCCSYLLTNSATITFSDLNSSFVIGSTPVTLAGDLPTLASDVQSGSGYHALANDYDAKNDQFSGAAIPATKGWLLGLGHTISNLTISRSNGKCGGFVGLNSYTVRDIHLTGLSIATNQQNVGGIAGCNRSQIFNVSVEGTIAGNNTGNVGGIAGSNERGLSQSQASVILSGGQAGGIAGESSGEISDSFALGSVMGQSNSGGLVGANNSRIKNSYAMVSVSGNTGAAGGFVGFNNGAVSHSYSTGTVTGASGFTGGFVGYDPNERVSGSYWDFESSGLNNGAGFPVSDPGIVGLSTAQFRAKLPDGFKRKFWGQSPNINNGYPYLLANPPQ